MERHVFYSQQLLFSPAQVLGWACRFQRQVCRTCPVKCPSLPCKSTHLPAKKERNFQFKWSAVLSKRDSHSGKISSADKKATIHAATNKADCCGHASKNVYFVATFNFKTVRSLHLWAQRRWWVAVSLFLRHCSLHIDTSWSRGQNAPELCVLSRAHEPVCKRNVRENADVFFTESACDLKLFCGLISCGTKNMLKGKSFLFFNILKKKWQFSCKTRDWYLSEEGSVEVDCVRACCWAHRDVQIHKQPLLLDGVHRAGDSLKFPNKVPSIFPYSPCTFERSAQFNNKTFQDATSMRNKIAWQ